MNALSDLREYIRGNLFALLAGVLILVILLVDLVFFTTTIGPGLRTRSELDAALVTARQDLASARQVEAETPGSLTNQISTAQTSLLSSLKVFLTDAQVSQIINSLYQYAGASAVTIVDLQTQSGAEASDQGVYQATAVRLQVQGRARQLVEFVSRFREATATGVAINGVNIARGEVIDVLTLDLTLYSSRFATGEALFAGQPPMDSGAIPAVLASPAPASSEEAQLAQRLDQLWAADNWTEAIAVVEQIRAINPNYPEIVDKLYAAHVNLGYTLLAEGRTEDARAEFTRALAVKPDGGEAAAALNQLGGTSPAPPAAGPQPTIYVVRPRDTLYSISRRYGTTVQAIMAANGLVNFNIRVGQQLVIPTP
jgi:LysM repeat protein